MSLQLHSVTLLNIADHVTRESDTAFGVLVGRVSDSCTVYTSFELLLDSTNTSIDNDYLYRRCTQFTTVLPHYSVVGLYHIGSLSSQNEKMIQDMMNQFSQFIKNFSENSSKNEPVATVLCASESENIASTTVANYKTYFTTETDKAAADDFSRQKHNKEIGDTLVHLSNKVERILQYLQDQSTPVSDEEIQKTIEINNLVVQLSNRLSAFRASETPANISDKLQSAQLGLITEQLNALDNVKSQIAKNLVRFGINTSGPPKVEQAHFYSSLHK
ncbi:predicted protein [Scheffersomyces stipitis CBS 6054]|uniref:JAB1/MPN/MOV34 metalloenzyme domain-containing protein n=1 Tax=Scheffersomyces stipitis (strain ATCC 58785 / CBS 6054 / NBRC 10063 / NRRL Y-11545) TaxID=322104 RepID=A3LN28_PICST|nr:predicted protein [Scheffersomyces stipitis CBS 6054]ABN64787.2 predicted protein [Scheffersomyces stipitis CBS 6054]